MYAFHEFASEWFHAKAPELRPNSAADYEWAISVHLLPHFQRFRLSEITIEEVDRYKRTKAREGNLSPATINKTLTRLAQILEDAVEYGYVDRNPAKGRRRRLKADQTRSIHIDTAGHIQALLDAADALDGTTLARSSGRRPLAGTGRDKDNIARRVMAPTIKRADELLAERGEALLPEGITVHKLRHTFASLLAACGEDPAYVMSQTGRTDPRFTLRVYTHLMSRRDGERDRLRALVEGADWAATGSESISEALADEPAPTPETQNPTTESGIPPMGVTGLEPVTSSLSSWRSPN